MTRSLRLDAPALALALALALAAADARAEPSPPSPEDVKRADQLFREGQRLLKQARIVEACAAFAESQKLDPALGTLLNLADCHAQERRFATARAEFEEAARLAAQSGQRERETFAREQLKQLEPVLSLVTIKGAPEDTFQSVRVDGRELDVTTLNAPIALDPGPHELRFAAAGRLPRTMRIDVANGPSSQTLAVPRLDPVSSTGRGAPAPAPSRKKPENGDTRRIAGAATAGGGALFLLAGTYFGLHAGSKKSDAEPHCNGRFCDAEGLSLQSDAHTAATLSTITFALGVVAVGAGAYLYLTAPRGGHAIALAPAPGGASFVARW